MKTITLSLFLCVAASAQFFPPVDTGGGVVTGPWFPPLSTCCDYYVAPDGLDSNPGTIAAPWQTISKVNATTLTAGQSVGFKRGGTAGATTCTGCNYWRERLDIPSSGSAGNLVSFQAYGTGVNPIITGANLVSGGWTQDSITAINSETFNSGSMSAFWGTPQGVADSSIHYGASANSWKYAPTTGNSLVSNANPAISAYWEIIAQVYIQSSSTMTNGQKTRILGQESASWNGANGVFVWASKSGSNYQLSIGRGSAIGSTPVTVTADAFHLVRMVVSTGSGAGNDFARLYVDGSLVSSATGLTLTAGATTQLEQGSFGYNSDKLIVNFGNINVYNADSTSLPNRWYSTVTTQPYIVLFDEYQAPATIAPQSSAANVVSANQWYWASNTLYVYSVGNPATTYTAPGIQPSARTYSIVRNGQSYFQLKDLITEGAGDVLTNAGVFIGQTGPGDSGESSGVVIDGLECRFNGKEGLWLDSIGGIERNGYYHDNRNMGIDFDTGAGMTSTNARSDRNQYGSYPGSIFAGISGLILNNFEASGNTQNGLVLSIGATYAINGGSLHDNTFNGLYLDGTTVTGAVINGVSIYNNGDTGIRVAASGATNVVLQYNSVYNNTNANIYIASGNTSTKVYNNTIVGPSAIGLRITGSSTNATVENNITQNNTVEVQVDASSAQSQAIDYNDWYHPAGGSTFLNWKGTSSNFASWKTNSSGDANSISTDPLMTNPASADFSLQAGSPALAAGVNIPTVSTSATPNIGAK